MDAIWGQFRRAAAGQQPVEDRLGVHQQGPMLLGQAAHDLRVGVHFRPHGVVAVCFDEKRGHQHWAGWTPPVPAKSPRMDGGFAESRHFAYSSRRVPLPLQTLMPKLAKKTHFSETGAAVETSGISEPATASPRLKLSLRLLHGEEIALGPGKADLLEAIARTGSISAAGKRMGMSYRRAWDLVDVMNRCFKSPLVETAKGGSHGGGARLTPLGEEVLAHYRAMDAAAKQVAQAYRGLFEGLMGKGPTEGEPSKPP